jgi:hypothetical protein
VPTPLHNHLRLANPVPPVEHKAAPDELPAGLVSLTRRDLLLSPVRTAQFRWNSVTEPLAAQQLGGQASGTSSGEFCSFLDLARVEAESPRIPLLSCPVPKAQQAFTGYLDGGRI